MHVLMPKLRMFSTCPLVLVAVLSAVAFTRARAWVVPTLPTPTFVDTEVSTNIHIKAWSETTRLFNVVLEFDATPSNNVQVAFGMDESTDGNLSDEETGLTLGWDCGEWFVFSQTATNRFTSPPAGAETRKVLSFQMSLNNDGTPRTLEVSDGNTSLAFSDLAFLPVPPEWMVAKNWNLFKVTARGVDGRNEQISVKLSNEAVILLLR